MIRLPPPGTLRQAVIYAGAVLLMLLGLGAWLWSITAGRVDAQLTQLIESESYTLHVVSRDGGREKAMAEVAARFDHKPIDNQIAILADENLRPLAGNLTVWPAGGGRGPGWHTITIMREPGPSEARVLYRVLPDGSHFLYGYDLTDFLAGRKSFVVAFMGVSVPLVVAVLLIGFFIRRSLLEKIDAINEAARAIMQGNLKERVPERGNSTELDLLASTINRMLDHTEHLVGGITNVSNAIAHDLRTPLAEARSRLESLLARLPSSDEAAQDQSLRREIEASMADIDKLIRTFNALIRMAQIETGARQSGFRAVELPEVVSEAVEFYQHVAEEKGLGLTAQIPAHLGVTGDPSLIAQAIGNLIDNAIKYTPRGGSVGVAVSTGVDGAATIVVDDNGPGIPDAEKPKVTTRFYRGDPARGTGGTGLGLSLVAAVAALHGGNLTLANNYPGLRARLTLQAAARA
jgi:signal transduction histidine kinase